MRRYSEAVKADVRRRMSPAMRQSVSQIPAELGIHVVTIYNWMMVWRLQGRADLKSGHPVSAALIPNQLSIRLMSCATAIRPARIDRKPVQRNRLRAMVTWPPEVGPR